MSRLLVLLALLLLPAFAGAQQKRPRLAVVLVVDQLRSSDLERLAPHFTGGFKRLQAGGALFIGRYAHQNTYTGPGHALILSGSYPYLSGIFQNKWYNRASKRSESMLFDGESRWIGGGAPEPGDETSPRNFNGSTVGDELRLATGLASKTVSLAVKERGAILLGGRTGAAYFFNEKDGAWTSTTWYMPALPQWVTAFNAKKLPDADFGKSWERALPVGAYAAIGPDDQAWEANIGGMGRTFPHVVNGGEAKPGAKFYDTYTHTPFAIDHTFAFARAAIEGERLGARGVTDILAVSVSPTDLIGHSFGAFSHETTDALVRTDRAIGAFLADLDARFGKDYVVVLTADHGAALPPEQAKAARLGGERVKKGAIKSAVNAALDARFGKADWVVALEDPSVYLDRGLITERKLDPAEVERVAGEAILELPGFIAFYTRTQLLAGHTPPTAAARSVALSYFPARAGDVVLVQAPFSFWGKYGEKAEGGSHGSFYRYDSDVPLVFAGGRFKPGFHGEADMADLAATLAHVVGVTAPAACEGTILTRALR